ncbi:MAG: hypothetical protein RI554_06960 [Trueperaceae bacterium]|nr:hypothetical protein [Trueperaceae bacterium]
MAGLAVLLAYVARRPTLSTIARRVDHGAGLQQRLSTAFEVEERWGPRPGSTVARLLLEDVRGWLAQHTFSHHVGPTAPQAHRLVLAGTCVTAVVAFAVPVPAPAPETVLRGEGPALRSVTSDALEDTISFTEAIADRLASEPVAERDAYLRAVAQAFSDVSSDLRDGTIDADEADARLSDALAYLQDAVERTGGTLEDSVREALRGPQGPDARASGTPTSRVDDEPTATPGERIARDAWDVGDAGRTPPASPLERLADVLQRRADAREAEHATRSPSEGAQDASRDPYGNAADVEGGDAREGDPGREPMARVQGEAAGNVAGDARQSSEAAGDGVGDGSMGGEGTPSAFERGEAAVDVTPLASRDDAEGRRVEMQLAPRERPDAARSPTPQAERRTFVRADETDATRRPLGWTQRDVVRRYFLPAVTERDAHARADTNEVNE